MLNTLVHVYSVATDAFYNDREADISRRLTEKRNQLWRYQNTDKTEDTPDLAPLQAEIRELKAELKAALVQSRGIRQLRPEQLCDKSVISIFESNLTRTLGMEPQTLSDALVIVRAFYFDVFRDIVLDGFDSGGERYVFFSASAGQIRTKKAVFVKESLLNEHFSALTCGLTLDEINRRGGCNTNKYLAYLALCNTATAPWPGFDIDKAIVVEDFATTVSGEVDFIDCEAYKITRQIMGIPIEHTDGCGMILPQLSDGKNMMLRLPWIKGLLAAFPFDRFIEKHGATGKVVDIYGDEHDIVAEGIQVIFTKSQFKMWFYYDNWAQYKDAFKRYDCTAGICNVEADEIGNARINYQMLQTLTDITDDELSTLAQKSQYRLKALATERKAMLRALGAHEGNASRNASQECLRLYPELLQDAYFKQVLRDRKHRLEYDAWSGKLDVYGKYAYVVPDLYAVCEWLFQGNPNPKGLLRNGEVSCALFPHADKLDCLRSPHLFREHAIRKNVWAERPELQEWYGDRAIYTSCHDLISKMLQFDNDGDQLLVCAEKTLVDVAERNMKGVVPLYYDMKKAGKHPINRQSMYDGMIAAYKSGNIGGISNDISKIWNAVDRDIEAVKLLCMETNFTIDAAKTLYKPTRPGEIDTKLKQSAKRKLPTFFRYAKDKRESQVEERTESSVNRLRHIVRKQNLRFSAKRLGKFDARMLMDNPLLIHTPDVDAIAAEYKSLVKKARQTRYVSDGAADRHSYENQRIREEMLALSTNPKYVVDALIRVLFLEKRSRSKRMFWHVFGDIVLENLKRNLAEQCADKILCRKCSARFEAADRNLRCPHCGTNNGRTREIVCESCGEPFQVDQRCSNKRVCESCYTANRRSYKTTKQRQYR